MHLQARRAIGLSKAAKGFAAEVYGDEVTGDRSSLH
jgi:hypothetical protein